MEESVQEKESKKKQPAAAASDKGLTKIKLNLSLQDCHPLAMFVKEIKKRQIKDCDLAELVSEGLLQLDEKWWEKALEDHTPLEFRVQSALLDPQMREKLAEMLTSGQVEDLVSH